MWLFGPERPRRSRRRSIWLFVAGWIGTCVGSVGRHGILRAATPAGRPPGDCRSGAPFLDPEKFPPQPYMNEIYWQYSRDTPAFFRDSLVQFVARTYYLTRDNFDGSKSQAWAAGGWLAFRSGLIGDVFGVHVAAYTSQPIFAPLDEGGTRLLAPPQNSIGVLGQIYGRIQIGDQEIRGGRQLVDTPLINPQDNRMVPNTFEAATLVSLPDKDRKYDYSVGYIWNMKQRDSNDFIPMSEALAGTDVLNRGTAFGMLGSGRSPGYRLAAMDYNVQDFVNTGFLQAEYDFRQPKGASKLDPRRQCRDQRTVGANLLAGSPLRPIRPPRRRRCIMPDGLCSLPVR